MTKLNEKRRIFSKEMVSKFFSHVVYSECCWLWDNNKDKYGQVWISKNKSIRAHRWSYEFFIGPIGNLIICHDCDTPGCVNPFHLFAGTQKDNITDASTRKRLDGQLKTHCPKNHEYTKENTYFKPGTNRRHCYVCKYESRDRWIKRNLLWLRKYRRHYWRKRYGKNQKYRVKDSEIERKA